MRRPDWRRRLGETLAAAADRPFVFGALDCCLFAADCVIAQTGFDPVAEFRGRYTTARGAARILRRAGFANFEALFDVRFPATQVLGVGDLALIPEGGDGPAMAVVVPPSLIACFDMSDGLITLPLAAASKGWRVE